MCKTPHKHAKLIKSWADGAVIQFLNDSTNEFEDCKSNKPSWDPFVIYRVKPEEPKMIWFNGETLSAPETEAPKFGTIYFVPFPSSKKLFIHTIWENDSSDECCLKNGLVYLNKEDALNRAMAMNKFEVIKS